MPVQDQNSQNGQKIAGFDKRFLSRSLLADVSIFDKKWRTRCRPYLIPPPDPIHEKIAARMAGALSKFLTDNKIDGEVHSKEPICRSAEGSTDPEPDLM